MENFCALYRDSYGSNAERVTSGGAPTECWETLCLATCRFSVEVSTGVVCKSPLALAQIHQLWLSHSLQDLYWNNSVDTGDAVSVIEAWLEGETGNSQRPPRRPAHLGALYIHMLYRLFLRPLGQTAFLGGIFLPTDCYAYLNQLLWETLPEKLCIDNSLKSWQLRIWELLNASSSAYRISVEDQGYTLTPLFKSGMRVCRFRSGLQSSVTRGKVHSLSLSI